MVEGSAIYRWSNDGYRLALLDGNGFLEKMPEQFLHKFFVRVVGSDCEGS